jgi:hypothetical protein
MRRFVPVVLACLVLQTAEPETVMLSLHSPAFGAGQSIPRQYTCEGEDRSPPLAWSGVPSGTKSLALIVDDPDAPDPAAPRMTWVHWVVYNIPPETNALVEGASSAALPAGALEARNDFGRRRYGGPCPPIGRHRYFHKLYALDMVIAASVADKAELEAAMRGHVLAQAELIGTYQKGD